MRYLIGLTFVLAGLAGSPLSATAKDTEAGATTQEPAPEEPALELKLDDAGLQIASPPPRTPDGYTLEEIERRVKRAKIGLGVSAGIYALGLGLAFGSLACDEPPPDEIVVFPACSTALIFTGLFLATGGLVGMIVSGVRLARRKRDRNWLRQARHGTLRRVQWDLARSRLVF